MVRALLFAMIAGLFVLSGCGCEKAKEAETAQGQTEAVETKATEASAIINIANKEAFEKDVLKSTKPAVVKFYANWCGACKEMAGAFDELAKEMTDYAFYAVDIDAVKDLAAEMNISGVPTIGFFKDGKEVDVTKRHIGAASKEHLQTAIKEAFGATEVKHEEAKPEATEATK